MNSNRTIISDYKSFIQERYGTNENFENSLPGEVVPSTEVNTDEEEQNFTVISKEELMQKAEESEEPIMLVVISDSDFEEMVEDLGEAFDVYKVEQVAEEDPNPEMEGDAPEGDQVDEELTAGQKKLPKGLQDSILKKQGEKPAEDKEEDSKEADTEEEKDTE